MRAIVVAGGTGGHIYPALAILKKIKEKEPNSSILYIGTADRMEKDIVPKLGIDFIGIEMMGLDRKNIFKNFKVIKKYLDAIKKAKGIIKEFKPDVVIGAGGYVTAPVLYAAHLLKIKTVIHEQNSIPGLSNKFISNFADRVFISLPGSIKYFKNKNVIYTGNPRSEEIYEAKKESKTVLGFDKDKKLVVIVMGSLGSTTMNNKIKSLIPHFKNKNYEILILTGKKYYERFNKNKLPKNVKLYPFLDNFINILKDSDLIISRAGASTIAEITAISLPAIFVPSPYVTNNHQYLNAKELEDNKAAIIISEDDFNSTNVLKNIDLILNNKIRYNEMKQGSKKFKTIDSCTKIYNEIKKLVG